MFNLVHMMIKLRTMSTDRIYIQKTLYNLNENNVVLDTDRMRVSTFKMIFYNLNENNIVLDTDRMHV